MTTQLLDLLDLLRNKVQWSDLDYEVRTLRAIRDWAVKQVCDFTVGDRVELLDSLEIEEDSGWWAYRDALGPGQTAVVKNIDYSQHYDYWYAAIVLDREWSGRIGDRYGPFWHGRADETPAGFKPPSDYDQKHYPDGNKHTFWMPVRHLRKAQEQDQTHG